MQTAINLALCFSLCWLLYYIPFTSSQLLKEDTIDQHLYRCGSCEDQYVQRMKSIHPELEEISRRSVCFPPIPIELVSDKKLIIGAGPGTTATRSISKAINFLGFRVLHYGILLDRDGFTYGSRDANSCNGWEDNLLKYGANSLYALLLKSNSSKECAEGLDTFDYRLYDNIDAIFDAPLNHISYRLLKYYPNSKVIFTDRDPYIWVEKRAEHQLTLPAIQTPCLIPMKSLTVEQNVMAYKANFELLKCVLPPDQFLVVNVWEQDSREIFRNIAEFSGREVPPPECALPTNVNHCLQRDHDVIKLRSGKRDSCLLFQKRMAELHNP